MVSGELCKLRRIAQKQKQRVVCWNIPLTLYVRRYAGTRHSLQHERTVRVRCVNAEHFFYLIWISYHRTHSHSRNIYKITSISTYTQPSQLEFHTCATWTPSSPLLIRSYGLHTSAHRDTEELPASTSDRKVQPFAVVVVVWPFSRALGQQKSQQSRSYPLSIRILHLIIIKQHRNNGVCRNDRFDIPESVQAGENKHTIIHKHSHTHTRKRSWVAAGEATLPNSDCAIESVRSSVRVIGESAGQQQQHTSVLSARHLHNMHGDDGMMARASPYVCSRACHTTSGNRNVIKTYRPLGITKCNTEWAAVVREIRRDSGGKYDVSENHFFSIPQPHPYKTHTHGRHRDTIHHYTIKPRA